MTGLGHQPNACMTLLPHYVRTLKALCVYRDIFTTSEMRVRITGHQILAKSQPRDEEIDLQSLFEVYWGSNMREFTVPSQS